MQSALHPVFEAIFRPLLPESAEIKAYHKALREHDWDYEYTDDHGVYVAGLGERVRLDAMQQALDPDRIIWNTRAPKGHRKCQPSSTY